MFLNYANSPNDKPEGNMNKNTILEINSCGTYKLYTKAELPTFRNSGRTDYQLIYLAAGKGYYYFDEETPVVLEAGHMVIYHPNEPQRYIYYGEDHPEIYWIHFTGADIDKLFGEYGIHFENNVIASGTHADYTHLFQMIIWELQLQKDFYAESAALYFRQLLIMLGRFNHKNMLSIENGASVEIEQAAAYFHEHYRENINIEEYVESVCLSNSLFFRKFKHYTGMTQA